MNLHFLYYAIFRNPKMLLRLSVFTTLLFVLIFNSLPCFCLNSDGLSLLALKAAITSDPTRVLDSWTESDSTPCHWSGVVCTRNRVTSLFLPKKGLTGYIPSELGLLDSLRRLNLAKNNFSKPIPTHLFNATSLLSLDLSQNYLSGPIPPQIITLKNLTHLDLSSNLLNGTLPEALMELKNLAGTLNLSYNSFSGEVPNSYGHFPVMVSLDLRHNNLTGKIPQVGSLLNQGPTAFSGNPSLCGFPLSTPCPEAQDPRVFAQSQNPRNPRVSSFPNSMAAQARARKSSSLTIPVICAVAVVVGVVSGFAWVMKRKRWSPSEGKKGKEENSNVEDGEMDEEGQKDKFVVMDEGFNLELEDLLRASAYVVGKSRSGIVYKVVVGRGSGVIMPTTVAVRRLSEGDATWRLKDFENEVEAIARVNHPNIVRLRAYYYAHDEKLLVSDYIRNGTLHTLLHGGPSKPSSNLSWAERLRIAQGTARGLTCLHEHTPRKFVHGNLKSAKILLDDEYHPYISGFGLTRLSSSTSGFAASSSKKHGSNPTILSSKMELKVPSPSAFYLAPEVRVSGNKLTQKCDVYSFGIILLEILTGRLPDAAPENGGKGLESLVRKVFREERPLSEVIDPALIHEVNAKKQVVAAFHIALNCTELNPELRPRMRTVFESLERIKLQ